MQNSSKRSLCAVLVLWLVVSGVAVAIGGGAGNRHLKTPGESVERFRALKYGAFIHWNPCTLTGLEVSWFRGKKTPREEYDALYKRFNPTEFDAAEWVRLWKDAGFKYVVFVPKHHDGFCMWDTKTTDYNIMNSPFGRDVTKELADECRKQGLVFCLYYSIIDFYHPDCLPAGFQILSRAPSDRDFGGPGYDLPEGQTPDFERYVEYMKTQLRELSDLCGPALTWWFDGTLSPLWTPERGADLYAYMRKLQPQGLFGNRVDSAFRGQRGGVDEVYLPTWFPSEQDSAGDYAVLEGGCIPRFDRNIPWEYTHPAKTKYYSWSSHPLQDISVWKDWLVKSACGDGNFNLGISAAPTGKFDPETVEGLRRMGHWLEHYGESLYGTRGGPYMRTDWYGSTCRDNKIYLHIFKTDTGKLILPPLGKKIVSSSLMTGGTVDVKQTNKSVTVTIAEYDLQPTDTIVVLEIKGSAVDIEPIDECPVNTGKGVVVSASNVRGNKEPYRASNTSDGDMSTYWTTDKGVTEAYVEYDLGKDRTFSRAVLFEGEEEGQYSRIRKYAIQAKIDGQWKTVGDATGFGNFKRVDVIPLSQFYPEVRFAPVTARFVRLNIPRANDSPVVHEFKLYER